jgi:hypothetical protein
MCPVCIATTALLVAKASSAGGLTALIAKKLHSKTSAKRIGPKTSDERGQQANMNHPNHQEK